MEVILKYFSDFTPQQLDQLKALDGLYKEWNEKINVISRKDIGGLYEFQPGMEIIDLGTGGGFPGIPLAIFFPEVKFHLVDSIAKKLKVVAGIAEAIGLTNITIQRTRAEEIKNRKFDFVVSRAVAPLQDLWKWSKPLLRKSREPVLSQESGVPSRELVPGGSELRTPNSGLICLKGGDLATEIQESGARPRIMDISEIFPEEYFREKFILYVPR
jgi:16S rRNA (guanine527-N7)-methyltransferase